MAEAGDAEKREFTGANQRGEFHDSSILSDKIDLLSSFSAHDYKLLTYIVMYY